MGLSNLNFNTSADQLKDASCGFPKNEARDNPGSHDIATHRTRRPGPVREQPVLTARKPGHQQAPGSPHWAPEQQTSLPS